MSLIFKKRFKPWNQNFIINKKYTECNQFNFKMQNKNNFRHIWLGNLLFGYIG